ncbi:hypothetical protein UFOVP105_13 [uncultured Caudovirales phage]|uniref:Uncharacterized protein n=1 Tax=uncultured Caudovirales phage TaxID=2100421 RepID=A0A6J5L432_9CAUD|nr:hypothetical protein UFOVP105_13 [uncultured Caudovirales phage]
MGNIVKEGQDIFDVSIQFYGSIEAGVIDLITSNNLNFESVNLGGSEITLNNNNNVDKKVVSFFSNNNFVPNNGGPDVVHLVLGDFNDDFNNDFYI